MKSTMYSRSLVGIPVVLLLWLSAVSVPVDATPGAEDVRVIVDTFLRVEYEEDTLYKRENLIMFAPQRWALLENKTEPGIGPSDLHISDQAFVVSAYEIVKIEVKGNRATAMIAYQRLARIKGYDTSDRTITPDKKDKDLVTLDLVFDKKKWWSLKGQWWILDPPPPRVSKRAMVEYYETGLEWYVDRQKEIGKLPEHQQDAYDRKSGILRYLKSLP